MFDRLVKALAAAALVAALSTGIVVPKAFAQAAAPAEKKVKDQAEYDALTAANKETDLAKKLDLLKVWQDKYPDSDFKNDRTLAFVDTWSKIAGKTLQTSPTADTLAAGKSAAQNLLDNLEKAFAPETKPAAVTDDQWKGAKSQIEQQAHITLGWIAMQQKDYPAAESQFKTVLTENDQQAQVSYWLGTVVLFQKRRPEAFYHFARAISIAGPTAMAPEAKAQASAYLTKAFNGYHGDDPKALEELKALAAKSAMPPADFTIESIDVIEKKKFANEEEFLKAHPDLALWRNLKTALTAADGDAYFTANVKGTTIPQTFKAKIVSMTPDPAPTELKVSIDDPNGDATIKFAKPLKGKIEVGAALDLQGNPESYTKDPFAIIFDGDESKITGLPPQTAAKPKAPVHHAPVHHKKA